VEEEVCGCCGHSTQRGVVVPPPLWQLWQVGAPPHHLSTQPQTQTHRHGALAAMHTPGTAILPGIRAEYFGD